jgi:glycosyltransferase involved in cell wall biosynthesis
MSRPLKWLLMAGHVPPDGQGGGIVRYTVELAAALRRRDDVELHLLTSASAAGALSEITGSERRIVPLPAVPDALLPAVERHLISGRLSTFGFDVVQGTKHLLPRRVAAQTVLTVHDMILFDRPQDFPAPKRLLLRRPYAASLQQADALVCVSAATLGRLTKRCPHVAGRAGVVPLATSSRLLASVPRPVPGLEGRPFGLVVGDPSPRKNLRLALEAWTRVVRRRPDAVLALVGPPAWGAEAYGEHHAELVASGHVVQLVGVDDGTLRWCYENARVVLAPSLVEGFGLPAVEALDLGAPLITSLDPALVEVSGQGAEHLPADDASAWARAVLDHLEGPAHRSVGERPVRTWDDVAAETISVVMGARDHTTRAGG